MKKIFPPLLLAIHSLGYAVDTAATKDAPFFVGKITEESVNNFISKYENRSDITEIIITSDGGDIKAGIKLGKWVYEKGLNVTVPSLCYSSCANYVFIAGKKKLLKRGSFVAWHGDVEQKDFRELIDKYDKILLKRKTVSLNNEEKLFLDNNKIKYESINELRQSQAELYSLLKVKSEFGRIGQEPINYPSDGWTLTKKAMQYFGISNVEVPKGYGTIEYFSQDPLSTLINKGPLLILDVDNDGKIFPVNLREITENNK